MAQWMNESHYACNPDESAGMRELPPHSISLGTRKDAANLSRDQFIRELEDFIDRWSDRKSFAGKTAALKALRRIPNLSALRK